MEELINRLLANDLAGLRGLKITGTVPLSEALLNDTIREMLDEAAAPSTSTGSPAETTTAAAVDKPNLTRLLRYLDLKVRPEAGQLVVDFVFHID